MARFCGLRSLYQLFFALYHQLLHAPTQWQVEVLGRVCKSHVTFANEYKYFKRPQRDDPELFLLVASYTRLRQVVGACVGGYIARPRSCHLPC